MSRTYKDSPKGKAERGQFSRTRKRNISVRAVRREQPDLRQLSRAVIAQALAEVEAEEQSSTPSPEPESHDQ